MASNTGNFKAQEYSGATKTITDIADLQRRMEAIISHADIYLPALLPSLNIAKDVIDRMVDELYGKE